MNNTVQSALCDVYAACILGGCVAGIGAGVAGFLIDFDLVPNNQIYHFYHTFRDEFPNCPCPNVIKAIAYSPISVGYTFVGGVLGACIGICLPLAIPMYGLIKLREKLDN